jgi:hypothetical protein
MLFFRLPLPGGHWIASATSPGGAESCSQWRKPLVNEPRKIQSPGGATLIDQHADVAPPGLSVLRRSVTKALRPWLHDFAPPGRCAK